MVVESAALAHDLGHPPFGHVAEVELNRLLLNAGVSDGFEGNAQSFRIVTKLAIRHPDCRGLNLTRATLAAVLKYPWLQADAVGHSGKWGCYETEVDDFRFARQMASKGDLTKTLEAALMDWADDIAYAVHDVDDFVRAGLIPLDRLVSDATERRRFVEEEGERQQRSPEVDTLSDTFDGLMRIAPLNYDASHRNRAELRRFSSLLVNRYISAVQFVGDGFGEKALHIDSRYQNEVAMLKGLTWQYVIRRQSLTTQRHGQRSLTRSLFELFGEAVEVEEDWTIFPRVVRDFLSSDMPVEDRYRLVADVIASMTETQVMDMYLRLTGQSLGSAMDQVLI